MTAPQVPSTAGSGTPAVPWFVNPPGSPHLNVQLYLDGEWSGAGRHTLMYHRGSISAWTGTHWTHMAADTLRAELYDRFENAVFSPPATQTNPSPLPQPYNINPARLKALYDGVLNKVLVDEKVPIPCWLDGNDPVTVEPMAADGRTVMRAHDVLACTNGIVHLPTRSHYSNTPRFLTHFSVQYPFNPYAEVPSAWLAFLHSLWPDDSESIDCLQEIFGYLLTARNEQQKMFMLYGPKRAGKGTILRVMQDLLGGDTNVTSTSVNQLNTQFGLANLEDKTVAVMSDLRFRSKDDGTAVENLLKITGDDPVLIDKKYKDPYQAKLATRFVIASNELPKMRDESGALQSRIILLKFTESFIGREDTFLYSRLASEFSGILNWALDGLDRLNLRGKFVQPKSGLDDLETITGLTSPTFTFMEDCCELGFDYSVTKDALFAVWRDWCVRNGAHAGDASTFGKNLRAAVPKLEQSRPRLTDGTRPRIWHGIGLNGEAQNVANMLEGLA